MQFLFSLPTRIGIVAAPLLAVACSNSPSSSDGGGGNPPTGGTVSFKTDLVTQPLGTPSFEFSCGLSSSCHRDPVMNPKTHQLFLGCNTQNMTCTATEPVAE